MDTSGIAYENARKRISRAKREGWGRLVLNKDDVRSITSLPDEINELPGLSQLDLEHTQIRDLTSLDQLPELSWLSLMGTEVVDISMVGQVHGLVWLDLRNTRVSDISPLAKLAKLEELYLSNTLISDLSPLVNLMNLRRLDIRDTPARDLRPLVELHELTEDTGQRGLTFLNCAATKFDKRINEISELEDNKERTRELFDYLKDWEPVWQSEPTMDVVTPVTLDDNVIELVVAHPTDADDSEPLKHSLHRRLNSSASDFARISGNNHPRLTARARRLQEQLERDFYDLDLLLIHLEVEDLKEILSRRDERSEDDRLSPDLVDIIADIVQNAPGLTLGNPAIDILEERKSRFLDRPKQSEQDASHQEFSKSIKNTDNIFGPDLHALESRLSERGDEASTHVIRKALHRNVLIRIAKLAGAGAGTILLGAAGSAFWDFISLNWATIDTLVTGYGIGFRSWFMSMLFHAQEAAGIIANVDVNMVPRTHKKARKRNEMPSENNEIREE